MIRNLKTDKRLAIAQAIVSGIVKLVNWTAVSRPSVRVHVDMFARIMEKLRELASVAVKAEAEAQTKFMMRGKELKEKILALEASNDVLAKQVDEQCLELQAHQTWAEVGFLDVVTCNDAL